MKIKLALSKYWQNEKGKIPLDRRDIWNEFNGSFTNREIDIDLFPLAVQKGLAYTAQHKNYRKSENFLCSQFLALDFDTEDEKSTFEYLLQDNFIKEYCYFLHSSPSHTDEKPRTRVVFVLDECISDKNIYGQTATAFVEHYELSDGNCKDCARFFYGSKDCELHINGKILPISVFNKLILEPYQEKQAKIEQEKQSKMQNMQIAKPISVPERLLKIHREKLLEHIRNAPDGQKHYTILKICTTLGGYIASGYYDFNDCFLRMKDAIIANPHNVKNFQAAFDTIEKSLYHGMESPLYFEDRYSPQLNNPNLAFSTYQKVEVQKMLWQAYHDGMTERDLDLWQGLGFTQDIVRYYGFGYRHRKIDTESGEVTQSAFTIPFKDRDGSVLNIEYRHEDGITYENDLPFLFETDNSRNDCQMIVLPDSLTALNSYLMLGECDYNFVGLPHMRIVKDTIEYDGAVILLEPDTDVGEYGLGVLKGHCRFLKLRKPMRDIIKYVELGDFRWLLNQAVRW